MISVIVLVHPIHILVRQMYWLLPAHSFSQTGFVPMWAVKSQLPYLLSSVLRFDLLRRVDVDRLLLVIPTSKRVGHFGVLKTDKWYRYINS